MMKFNSISHYLLKITGVCSLIFCLSLGVLAQSNEDSHDIRIVVPKSSTIHIKGDNDGAINLVAEAPQQAGQPLSFTTSEDNSLWLNYSAVSQEGKNIYASIVDGELPSGLGLTLDASITAESGQGNLGQSQGRVTLSTENQSIVEGITTCYTGDGTNKGRQLAYQLVALDAYKTINATTNMSITVCYTITD